MTQWLTELYEKTDTFNTIAGNNNRLAPGDLKSQMNLIIEEVIEMNDKGFQKNNPVEIIDGLMDAYVTVSGMASRLKLLGYDVEKAARKVADNNLTKYPISEATADATITAYAQDGIQCSKHFNSDFSRWAVIDSNGKVRKPVGYRSVDLSDCIPQE